jgi:putative endonuclease
VSSPRRRGSRFAFLRTTYAVAPGVTSNLAQRIEAHRNGTADGFTKEYAVYTLVYFEVHDEMYDAIQREKRLKKWNRAWKIVFAGFLIF